MQPPQPTRIQQNIIINGFFIIKFFFPFSIKVQNIKNKQSNGKEKGSRWYNMAIFM